ncbi:TonB-dependent receptor plug domain-containing protein [Cellvibrio sp. OA-2007]|uniref:TonB-dependent receptor plug domain-containing protein n=1 Tax=Cellvibrio sp. OA-2007 TaxID=529823 RepID=UPI00187C53BB|nr:TonB-dependent receptor [Cellvibrio sp. OA-2007]
MRVCKNIQPYFSTLCMVPIIGFSTSVFSANYFDLSLDELLQVQITGSTLKNESYKTVPSPVTVFERKEIDNLGVDYLYELINLVPGYQFNRNADSPSGYTMSSRGRRISSEAREILLLVDGRVFSDPRTGGADGSLPLFPVDQIERVEILRGPGSALYGSNALNGVINVITRSKENSVALQVGSENRVMVSAAASTTFESGDANLLARFYQDSGQQYSVEDPFTATQVATQDPRQTYDIDGAWRYHNTQVRVAFHTADSEDFYVGGTIDNDVNEYIQTLRQISVTQQLSLAENLKSSLSISYLDITQDTSFPIAPEGAFQSISSPASDDSFIIKVKFAGSTYRINTDHDLWLSELDSVQFGLDWHKNNETDAYVKNNFDLLQLYNQQFPITYYGDFTQITPVGTEQSQEALGIYTQYLRNIHNTNLTLGLRFDDYENVGSHISPRLGIVHQFNTNHTFKLLYGEAYRAPSLSEQGLINNPVLLGNAELNYEVVKSIDAIWLLTGDNSSFSVDFFQHRYKNPIETVTQNELRTYLNTASETTNGAELELKYGLSENWLLNANFTHIFSLLKGQYHEASNVASVTLNYSAPHWNLNFSGIYHDSKQFLTPTGTYTDINPNTNLNIKYRYLISKDYEINLTAKNVFGTAFDTPPQGSSFSLPIPNRERELALGIQWHY